MTFLPHTCAVIWVWTWKIMQAHNRKRTVNEIGRNEQKIHNRCFQRVYIMSNIGTATGLFLYLIQGDHLRKPRRNIFWRVLPSFIIRSDVCISPDSLMKIWVGRVARWAVQVPPTLYLQLYNGRFIPSNECGSERKDMYRNAQMLTLRVDHHLMLA